MTKARLGLATFSMALLRRFMKKKVCRRGSGERQLDRPAWGSLACCLSAEATAPTFPPSPLPFRSAAGRCEWSAQARCCWKVRPGTSLGTPVKLNCDSGAVGTMACMAGCKGSDNRSGSMRVLEGPRQGALFSCAGAEATRQRHGCAPLLGLTGGELWVGWSQA